MDRSIRFNNAGVACYEAGQKRIAWDLFKGALEVRLALERLEQQREQQQQQQLAQEGGSSSSNNIQHLATDNEFGNEYIRRAQEHFLNLGEYLHPTIVPTATTTEGTVAAAAAAAAATAAAATATATATAAAATATATDHDVNNGRPPAPPARQQETLTMNVDEDDYSNTPFLYMHPLELDIDNEELIITRRHSATIIFNLALIDHTKNRHSQQAVALYELALTLIAGDPVDLLGIALINNMGVWCYENGDYDGTMNCMSHLSTFIRSQHASMARMTPRELQGLQSNILWLVVPPAHTSPAA